jgi:hypothetical protein
VTSGCGYGVAVVASSGGDVKEKMVAKKSGRTFGEQWEAMEKW